MSVPIFCSPWCDCCTNECLNDEPCLFVVYPFIPPYELLDPFDLVDDYGE